LRRDNVSLASVDPHGADGSRRLGRGGQVRGIVAFPWSVRKPAEYVERRLQRNQRVDLKPAFAVTCASDAPFWLVVLGLLRRPPLSFAVVLWQTYRPAADKGACLARCIDNNLSPKVPPADPVMIAAEGFISEVGTVEGTWHSAGLSLAGAEPPGTAQTNLR